MSARETTDVALNTHYRPPFDKSEISRFYLSEKLRNSDTIDLYEWNSLAISMIEFRNVDSRAVRPTWSDIFTHQTRVAMDLDASWRQLSFTYRHRYWVRSLSDLGKGNLGGLFYCKAVFPNKFKFLQQGSINHSSFNINPWIGRSIDGFMAEIGELVIGNGNRSQSQRDNRKYLISHDYFLPSLVPFIDLNGKGVIRSIQTQTDQRHRIIVGPLSVQSLELGIVHLFVISASLGELWSVPLENMMEQGHAIDVKRVPHFVGIRVSRVSSLVHTAILTSSSEVFLMGPLFDHLPCPFMVRWSVPDDCVISLEMTFSYLLLATKKGHLYKLDLEAHLKHPRLIYASDEHLIRKVTFCGDNACLALTRNNQLLLWNEGPVGVELPAERYPPTPLALVTKPTPVIVPWPVESASYFQGTLFVGSCRQYSYNAIFANFLNRAAFSTLDPFIKLNENDPYRPLLRLAFAGLKPKRSGYSGYQLDQLRGYAAGASSSPSYSANHSLHGSQQRELIASSSSSAETSLSDSSALIASSSHSSTTSNSINAYAQSAYTGYSGRSAYSGYAASTGYGSAYHISDYANHGAHSRLLREEAPPERNFAFNARLQEVYDMPAITEEERNMQHLAFAKLNTEFMEKAIYIVKVIVEEMMLPDEEKTFASLPSAGGVAGGEKYLVDGDIFVKLCIDNHSLYGGNEWSGKVANLELHGMDAYASCIPRLPQGSKLRVPLLSMVDYVGFRALVSTACPISKRTIVYGSNDAARTVHNEDADAERDMLLCASFLNLAPHKVKNSTSFIASAVDVEVHRGEDGNLYLLDTARVFPPVQPGVVKSVPLGDFSSLGTIHAKDLSSEQTSSLLKDLDSIPISEGLLFFKRPKAIDEPHWDSEFQAPDTDSYIESDMKEEEPVWVATEEELLQQDVSPSDNLALADSNFVNPIATALVGRVIRGDAWFLRNATGQRLFHQFRPEFVRTFGKALSSDALSGFSVDGADHDAAVREATTFLEQNYLVHIQTQLLSGSPYLDPWLNTNGTAKEKSQGKVQPTVAPLVYSPETLVRFMHRVGLNVRSIGHIRIHIQVQPFQAVSLIEMISRTCVSFIKRRLRAAHSLYAVCRAHKSANVQLGPSSSNAQGTLPKRNDMTGGLDDWENLSPADLDHFSDQPIDYLLKTIAIQAFNTIFAHSATSSFFWTQVLKVHLLVKFGADCLLAHESDRSYSLRADVPMSYLFQVISRRTGVVWDQETETQMQTAQWNSTPIALTIEHLLGFMLGTKSTKMGSLEQLKQNLHDKLFPREVLKQRSLPDFQTPESLYPCSEEMSEQYYISKHVFKSPDGGGYDAEDPALLPYCSPAPTAWRSRTTPLADPYNSTNDHFIPHKTPSEVSADETETQTAAQKKSVQPDGLDLYHERAIVFYEKWTQMLEDGGVKPTVLDEVRLLLCKMRPILDNRCPGGDADLLELDTTWKVILEKMKAVPRCNHELLAQLFYARGQMMALSGAAVVDIEKYYFAALNVLAAASFPGSVLGDQAGVSEKTGTAPFMLGSRRFLTHPFAMVVIEKLLVLHLEECGSVMASFSLWVLFRLVWLMCPFFGDLQARRRIFNGRDAPLALSHPWLWERTVSRENLPLASLQKQVEISRAPFWAFMSQAVFPLDSEVCQNWLTDVFSLESTCGYEISTHWLYTDPVWFPRFITTLFPITSFPPVTHSLDIKPLAPLNSVFNTIDTSIGTLDETWQWWMTFRPSQFSEFHHLVHHSGTLVFTPRILPLSTLIQQKSDRYRTIEYFIWRQYEEMREEAAKALPSGSLQPKPSVSNALTPSSSNNGGRLVLEASSIADMIDSNKKTRSPHSVESSSGAIIFPQDKKDIEEFMRVLGPSPPESSSQAANSMEEALPFVMGRYMTHETGRDFDSLKQVSHLRDNLNRFRSATDKLRSGRMENLFSETAQERFSRYYNSNEPLHGSIITFVVADRGIIGHALSEKLSGVETVYGAISSVSSERRLIRRVQYLDPSKPAPKRYVIHTSDGPEMYYVMALPSWFDHIGALSLDRYDVFNVPRGYLERVSAFGEESSTVGFACITNRGTLLISVGLAILNDGDEDWSSLKALDLAGETPVLLKFSKIAPRKDGFLYIAGRSQPDRPTIACLTQSGHLFIWGTNTRGMFGNGRHGEQAFSPKLVSSLMSAKTIDVDIGVGHIITLNENGIVNYWGNLLPETDTYFLTRDMVAPVLKSGAGSFLPLEKDLPLWGNLIEQKAIAIGAGSHFVVAVSNFGIPYFYGIRFDLANLSHSWMRIWCPERIVSISCGDWHTVMLSENGNIFCFGSNLEGQCGTAFPPFIDGFNRCLAPLHFDSLQLSGTQSLKFVQIGSHSNRSIALTDTGEIWSWGAAKQSSPHRIHVPQPIKYISLNSQGHHMFLTEMPNLPARTLPLVPIQHHLDAANHIISHNAEISERFKREQDARRRAYEEQRRDESKLDTNLHSTKLFESSEMHPSTSHVAGSSSQATGDTKSDDSILHRANSSNATSHAWIQPKMAGEVLNLSQFPSLSEIQHDEVDQKSSTARATTALKAQFGIQNTSLLVDTMQAMIQDAIKPYQRRIASLEKQVAALSRSSDSR